MFLIIFFIFFFAIALLGWWTWKNDSVPGYFIVGALVLLLGGILFSEGLDVQTGIQLTYASNGDVNQAIDIFTTQTKENDGLVAFMSYFLPALGLILIFWGIIIAFKPLEQQRLN